MVLARVRRTIDERRLLAPGERVLVACSGGPDSAALLHVLTRLAPALRLTLHAASVDHGLRPDAGRDLEVARQLAARLEVPFVALRVEVPPGASVQAEARRARYAALKTEAARVGASRVAVGHTRDDQAETVLSRILRGAGIHGLASIAPARDDGVIRPLIDCARADVHAHAARFSLPRVRDPSNDDAAFERVRLRRELMPILACEDPRLVEHLAALAEEARDVREMVRTLSGMLLREARTDDELDAEALKAASRPVRREALAAWVREVTGGAPRRAHVEALEALLDGDGEVLLPGRRVVSRRADRLAVRHDPSHPTRSRRTRSYEAEPPAADRASRARGETGGLRSARTASDH
ncbi:MAG TPA: tRNA lysidine(34) synthetase TilS [Sandaracinaceae bacterium LLY-WYZ-13_1]|nr:tRNA lysidine(34) synthetase TilS [Sandaracinaceae bacterium LLY-WYZ-13_1]